MSCPARLYPFRKPQNHSVPIPRWTLRLPEDVNHVYISYIGIQQHNDNDETIKSALQIVQVIQQWLVQDDGPATHESFSVLDDNDTRDSTVWVCYWTDPSKYMSSLENINLVSLHSSLYPSSQPAIGIWQESFTTAVSRLETNYSGLDYLPGLARLPDADTVEHTLSAYWGAARDRIPDSAHNLFTRTTNTALPNPTVKGRGQHLLGTNNSNLVHIRSGQFWENCSQQEADSYETKLEPTLRSGLQYLRSHADDTGAIALRYMRNGDLPADVNARQRKETCGAGFFANLEDLERWAKSHVSHLRIYRGAMQHYKVFGEARMFRTWHEVCVIEEAEARFEYVNCELDEGVRKGMVKWDSGGGECIG
jgi:hypothetical protein